MSAYLPAGRTPGPPALPWYRTVVRVVLVVVPAQVVGALLATLLLAPVDLRAHPDAPALLWVLPGVVAGVGLGLLVRLRGRVPWRVAALGAVVGAVSIVGLVLLGRARADLSVGAVLTSELLGGLLGSAALQTVVALGLWLVRLRRAPRDGAA